MATAPASGWVSFDDDNGSSGFGAADPFAAPSVAHPFPAAASAGQPQIQLPPAAVTGLPLAAAGAPGSHANAAVAPARPHTLVRPPPPASGPAHSSTAPSRPGASDGHFSPLTASAAQASFPSFAAIHGAVAGAGGGAGSSAAATDPGAVHRLPRPPTSAARAGAPAANPFAAHPGATAPAAAGVSAVPLLSATPAANPFAPSSTSTHAASAAARSLDPFADLTMRPALPRPPPMAAARSTAAVSAAAATGAAGIGTTATASASGGLPIALGQRTAAQAHPMFPTFASLHQQASASASAAPWADSGAAAPVPVSAASAAAAVAAGGSMASSAVGSPGGGPRPGLIETTSFDAFASPSKSVSAAGRPGQPQGFGAGTAVAFPSSPPAFPADDAPPPPASPRGLPPPPPYEEALSMSPGLPPPPPPYAEAITMPHAPPLPVPPPPPPAYEEALSMPRPPPSLPAAGESLPLAASELTTAGFSEPSAVACSFSWSVFDDGTSSAASRASAAASTGAKSANDAALESRTTDSLAALSLSPPLAPQPPPLPSQICVEVRLPPLAPKEAAWPKRLVAGMGSAFAAPGGDGVAALQWCLLPGRPGAGQGQGLDGSEAGPRLDLPPGAGAQHQRAQEDWDSAPAVGLPLPPLVDSPVTSMVVDDVSGSMWTGHKDGKVVRWSLGPGRAAAYEHHWKAHARGKVTCMALSPWGELWTGSSAGSLRSWQYLGAQPATWPPVRLFECRRARLALGSAARSAAQRAHSKARLVAVGPSGRVVWSAGRTGMVLWGAYDGEYLGSLTPGQAPGQEGRAAGQGAYAGDTGAVFRDGGWQAGQQADEINPQTGLDSSLVNRPFVPRAPPDGGDEAEGDPDLGLQVIKGLAGAAKFANKLRKRIQKNLVGDAQGGGADGQGGPGEPGFGPAGAGAGGGAGGSGGVRGKVVALVAGADSSMYVAYKGGVMEKYTEWGRLMWCRDYGRDVRLHSAALVGSLLWLGCGDGSIHTVSAAGGEPGRSWKAHDFPVSGLAQGGGGGGGPGGGLVFSLSENGSVRAWPAAPPSEAHLTAWRDGLLPCLRRRQLTLLAATWNVNETRPAPQSLRAWLAPRAAGAEIVAVALQEVEMGTSSVARDAALTFLSKAMLERGNQNAQWWASELAAALASSGHSWVRVALRQMSGLVAVVFCRAELRQHVGEVATANVACGVMGVGGNKGAVAVSMSVFRRRVMFLSSHFAAHQERVDERNDNYAKVVRQLHFDNTSKAAQRQKQQLLQQQQQTGGAAPAAAAADGALDGVGDSDLDGAGSGGAAAAAAPSVAEADHDADQGPGVSDAEMLVWAGDFNYRINGPYADVCTAACSGDYARLFAADQCRAEMDRGAIFRGLREPLPLGCPVFPPTYKFDKGEPAVWAVPPSADPAGRGRLRLPYDSSEKQRVPAWTDRILYRGSRPSSLDVAEEEVQVGVSGPHDYNCVLDVNDSDHKPVYAVLQVQLPAYKQDEKRRHSLAAAIAAARAAAQEADAAGGSSPQPQHPVTASARAIHVRPNGFAHLDLHNSSASGFLVQVAAERLHHGGQAARGERPHAPLPSWLEVSPASFVLMPAHGGDAGDPSQSRVRVLVRAVGCEGLRAPEPVALHFQLRPLWGVQTLARAVGPTIPVSLSLAQ